MTKVLSTEATLAVVADKRKTLLKMIKKSGKTLKFLVLQTALKPQGPSEIVMKVFLRGQMNKSKAQKELGAFVAADLKKKGRRDRAGLKAWQDIDVAAWGRVRFWTPPGESTPQLALIVEDGSPSYFSKLDKEGFRNAFFKACSLKSAGVPSKSQLGFHDGWDAFTALAHAEPSDVVEEEEIQKMEDAVAGELKIVKEALRAVEASKNQLTKALAEMKIKLAAHSEVGEDIATSVVITANEHFEPLWQAVSAGKILDISKSVVDIQAWLRTPAGGTVKQALEETTKAEISKIVGPPVRDFIDAVQLARDP